MPGAVGALLSAQLGRSTVGSDRWGGHLPVPRSHNGSPHVWRCCRTPHRCSTGAFPPGCGRTAPGPRPVWVAARWDPAHGRLVIDTRLPRRSSAGPAERRPGSSRPGVLDRQRLRRAGRHVARPRADRRGQAAAGHRGCPGRADRVPLGRFLEARGGRTGPPAVPPGAGPAQIAWRRKGMSAPSP